MIKMKVLNQSFESEPGNIICSGEILPFLLVENPVKLHSGVKSTGNSNGAEEMVQ